MKAKDSRVILKRPEEIEIMAEGGRKLARVKDALLHSIKLGGNAKDLNSLAEVLIKKEDGKSSFKMVPGYKWAICVNKNEGVVHGIPKKEIVFKKKDVISVDLGMFYRDFHTDTSFSLGLDVDDKTEKFLETGKIALKNAIAEAYPGGRIYDISEAIEKTVRKSDYSPIKALVGHGIGRNLHEEPQVPCFSVGKREDSLVIKEGLVIAIEVMYAFGEGDVSMTDDGWTIVTSDGTISALFEETVAITQNGPKVLT